MARVRHYIYCTWSITFIIIYSFAERGKFLALDLGGTNFRVLMITLGENHEFGMVSKIYAIAESIMTGSGEQLFDHIADCLAKFIKVCQ